MNEYIISIEEAKGLLDKLFSERLPVVAFFVSHVGTQATVKGFVDSITTEGGLVVSVSSPPAKGPGWISVPVFGREVDFSYGDVRLLPESMREDFASRHGDSVLVIRFPDADEMLALFFTP